MPRRCSISAEPSQRRPLGRAELLSLLEEHGLRPSRALGQNFLVDPNVVDRIVRLAGVQAEDHVVEVGAGLGSLTIGLAETGAQVVAIEADRHLVPLLRQIVQPLGVRVVHADAMSCEWGSLLAGALSWTLVANLPYNIATPLVLDVLREVPRVIRLFVMVQREAGERLAAPARHDAYGAASVRLSYFATASVVGRVPASVFVPKPKVESVLVDIRRRAEPAISPDTASFEEVDKLVRAGFGTRRKMLRRALGDLVTPEVFEAAGIAGTSRAEELTVEDWGRLAFERRRGAGGA